MSSTYGRHFGGYLWAIIEPIAALALMTFVFSLAFRSPALGNSFPLFYATGYLPFMLYSDVSNRVSQTIRYSRPLLFYPRVTFLDAILARFSLNLLVHLVVFFIIISAITIIQKTATIIQFNYLINSLLMASSLAFSVGVINCYFTTKFPVWDRVWSILNRPAFIVSGIFFVFESVPTSYQNILWFNPVIHIVGEMRKGIYPTYSGTYVDPVYVYGLSLFFAVIGLIFLQRSHRSLLYI